MIPPLQSTYFWPEYTFLKINPPLEIYFSIALNSHYIQINYRSKDNREWYFFSLLGGMVGQWHFPPLNTPSQSVLRVNMHCCAKAEDTSYPFWGYNFCNLSSISNNIITKVTRDCFVFWQRSLLDRAYIVKENNVLIMVREHLAMLGCFPLFRYDAHFSLELKHFGSKL